MTARDLTPNVTDCALAFEGGGYREAFSAGVATVLMDAGIRFGYVCGVSAGASNTVDYVSDDKRRVREAFMMHEAAREATGIRSLAHGHGYFDADALYEDAVTEGTLPFDFETFQANPAEVRIQAFQRDTGCTLRFGKEGMADVVRLMDIVRASSTLPGAMTPRPVDGHVLYDGGLGEGAGLPVCMAEKDGFARTFFVATRPRGYRKQPPTPAEQRLYERLAGDYPFLFKALLTRWERYNDELERIERLAAAGSIYVVWPERMMVSSGTTSATLLNAQYEAGRAQAIRQMPLWREFLFGSADGGPTPPDGWDGYVTIA